MESGGNHKENIVSSSIHSLTLEERMNLRKQRFNSNSSVNTVEACHVLFNLLDS